MTSPSDSLCPLMAEEGVVDVSPGYSVFMLTQSLSETGGGLAKVLLITGGTRNSTDAHLRTGRRGRGGPGCDGECSPGER